MKGSTPCLNFILLFFELISGSCDETGWSTKPGGTSFSSAEKGHLLSLDRSQQSVSPQITCAVRRHGWHSLTSVGVWVLYSTEIVPYSKAFPRNSLRNAQPHALQC